MFRKLRSYIDDQNEVFVEYKKEAKSKVAAAKEKVRWHKVVCSLFLDWCYCKLSYLAHIVVYMLSIGEKY